MNVIADAGSIGRFVIVPINGYGRSIACRGQNSRDQMRLGVVGLADFAFRIGARGIEVAQ